MSLLQDALRRLQKAPGEAAPAPGSPVQTPFPRSGVPNVRRLLAVAGGIAFLCGVAVVVVVLMHPSAPSVALPPRPSAQPVPAPPAVSPEPTSPAAPQTVSPSLQVVSPAPPVAAPQTELPAPARSTATLTRAAVPPAAGEKSPPPAKRSPARSIATARTSSDTHAPPADSPVLTSPAAPPADSPPSPAPLEKRAPASIRGTLLDDFNGGVEAQARGDFPAAAAKFRSVIEADPNVVEAWNNLGISLLRQGKVADAKAAFGRTLALDPGYPPGLVNAGLLKMANEGDPAGAAVLFAQAAAADPDSQAARVNLAIAQARLGKTGAALETLQAARRRFPRNADILYHTGTFYERTGNREKAAETYAAFLRESAGTRPSLESSVRERLKAWGKVP